jgi:hypothetical protein
MKVAPSGEQQTDNYEGGLIRSRNEAGDRRTRRNIRWGVVRGIFIVTLLMIPVVIRCGVDYGRTRNNPVTVLPASNFARSPK